MTILGVSIRERENFSKMHIFSYSIATEKRWKCMMLQLYLYLYIKLTTIYCSIHSTVQKSVIFFSCKMWTDIWMFTRKCSAIKKVVAKSSFIHSHVETVTKKKPDLHLKFWIFCWISLFIKLNVHTLDMRPTKQFN